MREARSEYVTKARLELNEAVTENQRVGAESSALADQVTRTVIKSPINGIVQKLYVNTVGGVIKPGDNLIEIVPTEGGLLVEAKIKPSDIAFIYPGQKAVVKVTAYDFSIYGSLDGVVSTISPDTETDEKENVYYIVRVQTNKKYLGSKEKPLKIIPGMMVNVDVITGKKTVLEYILKPLLRAKQYTFSER
jgi:adhesin transport system membrane fusion protein